MDYHRISYRIEILVLRQSSGKLLQKALGVQLLMSTAAHPQIDGSVRSCRQGNSEAVEILYVSGTGLRGIIVLPRIRIQRYNTIIY